MRNMNCLVLFDQLFPFVWSFLLIKGELQGLNSFHSLLIAARCVLDADDSPLIIVFRLFHCLLDGHLDLSQLGLVLVRLIVSEIGFLVLYRLHSLNLMTLSCLRILDRRDLRIRLRFSR